jgi:hypothetical protein
MLDFLKKRSEEQKTEDVEAPVLPEAPRRPFWETIMPVFACGAGLFSDGYINNASLPSLSHFSTALLT